MVFASLKVLYKRVIEKTKCCIYRCTIFGLPYIMKEKNLIQETGKKENEKARIKIKDILRKMKVRNVHESMVSDIVLWDIIENKSDKNEEKNYFLGNQRK